MRIPWGPNSGTPKARPRAVVVSVEVVVVDVLVLVVVTVVDWAGR